MRTQNVIVNGKTVIVNEKRVSELKDIFEKNKDELDKVIGANSIDDIGKATEDILYEKLPELFPVLKKEDIDNAYPSELEELVGAFIDVNFTGLKKVAMPMVSLILTGLKK